MRFPGGKDLGKISVFFRDKGEAWFRGRFADLGRRDLDGVGIERHSEDLILRLVTEMCKSMRTYDRDRRRFGESWRGDLETGAGLATVEGVIGL